MSVTKIGAALVAALSLFLTPAFARATPTPYFRLVPDSQHACDAAFDKDRLHAGEPCVEAGDDYATLAAKYQGSDDEATYALEGAIMRIQAAIAFKAAGDDKRGFDQAMLAYGIGWSWYHTTKDPYVKRACSAIGNSVYHLYPMVFTRPTPSERSSRTPQPAPRLP